MSRTQKSSRIQDVSKGLNLCFITVKLFTLSQEFSLPQWSRTSPPPEHTTQACLVLQGDTRLQFVPQSQKFRCYLLFKKKKKFYYIFVYFVCGHTHTCGGMIMQWHACEGQGLAFRGSVSPGEWIQVSWHGAGAFTHWPIILATTCYFHHECS